MRYPFRSSWDTENCSLFALVAYGIFFAILSTAGFLVFFMTAHSSISLLPRIILSLVLWLALGGCAAGYISCACLAELFRRCKRK